jgi:hypothetical protein
MGSRYDVRPRPHPSASHGSSPGDEMTPPAEASRDAAGPAPAREANVSSAPSRQVDASPDVSPDAALLDTLSTLVPWEWPAMPTALSHLFVG